MHNIEILEMQDNETLCIQRLEIIYKIAFLR